MLFWTDWYLPLRIDTAPCSPHLRAAAPEMMPVPRRLTGLCQNNACTVLHGCSELSLCWDMLCQAPMVQPAAPSEDGGLSSKEVSERFQQAQLAMAPLPNQAGASALPPRTAVAFLLAAHHPVITRPLSHRHSFWCVLSGPCMIFPSCPTLSACAACCACGLCDGTSAATNMNTWAHTGARCGGGWAALGRPWAALRWWST